MARKKKAATLKSRSKKIKTMPESFEDAFSGNRKTPKTLVEMAMMRFSQEIRRKEEWDTKMKDKKIVAKWRKEGKNLFIEHRSQFLPSLLKSKNKVNFIADEETVDEALEFVLQELEWYASKKDDLAEISTVDGVLQSDTLIPQELKERLLTAVRRLEDVPEEKKDWHPGSEGKMLDLVHPSLYPFVFGVSKQLEEPHHGPTFPMIGQGQIMSKVSVEEPNFELKDDYGDPIFYMGNHDQNTSKRYQWLPSDFFVDANGKVKIESYINNLHPIKDASLYHVIADIFEKFVPMFTRMFNEQYCIQNRTKFDIHSHFEEQESDERTQAKNPNIEISWNSKQESRDINLFGRRLQVIVKMANIEIDPAENYPGGTWHVEGMSNEKIVASGIYYYDMDNIESSLLHFREAVEQPYTPRDQSVQSEGVDECSKVYGMDAWNPLLSQERGHVECIADRCIVFPNTMQHRVGAFKLKNAKKPGVRKILVFFLVDPTIRILSTADVPIQRSDWIFDELRTQHPLRVLPKDVLTQIGKHASDQGMSWEDAVVHRLNLMKERSTFVDAVNVGHYERAFSLCEH
eukprot:TRINITY_DN1284_c0_g1_i4.p1 TRINITY_DN1284_c0_g1~~TRINITY_DN1284_c0_g1_i4.p1  ORF type:complete len:583 (+),score=153.64 TRINITY_DN1284_c0_g1_i4:31-1749(+)